MIKKINLFLKTPTLPFNIEFDIQIDNKDNFSSNNIFKINNKDNFSSNNTNFISDTANYNKETDYTKLSIEDLINALIRCCVP